MREIAVQIGNSRLDGQREVNTVDIAFLIGRIIAGGYFIMGGFNHFKNRGMMTGIREWET